MRYARSAALFLLLGEFLAASAAEPSRAPVLVELFTSEGCSSCPPADRILEQLDPHVVVLSEHVDYWDHDGWKDPYSSHSSTLRQENYGHALGVEDVYTPQMIVDGAVQFNGSDGSRAKTEIDKAEKRPKAKVRLERTDAGIQVSVEDAPRPASVYLVMAENSGDTQVGGGENKGRRLHHVAMVRSLKKIGAVKRGESFRKVVAIPPSAKGQRIVVFVQDADMGPVSGAAVIE